MKTLLVLAASLAVALPALAQEAEGDWDVARHAEKSMVIAYTVFDNGLGVGARCSGGNYQVLISGLPATTGASRSLRVAFRDDELSDQRWSVGDDATAPSVSIQAPWHAAFAREDACRSSCQAVIRAEKPFATS